MSQKDVSRRKYLKIVGGAVVAAGAAASAAWYFTQPTEEKLPTIRILGSSFSLPAESLPKWEEQTGGAPLDVTYVDFAVLSEKQLADPTAWDVGFSGFYKPHIDQGLLSEIPVNEVPRWKEDKVMEVFTHPENFFSPAQAERFKSILWHEQGKSLTSVPVMWNYDSIGYLPEHVPFVENGAELSMPYSELWNPEWKGKVMEQDLPFWVISPTANELVSTGQLEISGAITNLTKEELDAVHNFLLPIFKSGQYKTIWFKYGDAVTFLATKEVYLADVWNPVIFDVRKAGVPIYYACLQNGPGFWFNSNIVSKSTSSEKMPWVYTFLNWNIDLYLQLLLTKQAYPCPNIYWEDYQQAMGKEFYDWSYMGMSTYLPIDEIMKEIWPDKQEFWTLPEKFQQALFLVDKYFRHYWTGETPRTGSPHAKGNERDMGSVAFKQQITNFFVAPDVPDDRDYYMTKWNELKASLPA